jgi:signal transduction histidine kinase
MSRTLTELADEQAALRHVATLVAEGALPAELFAAVAEEVARLLEVSAATVVRFEGDSSVVVASFNDPGFPVGSRWFHDPTSLNTAVLERRAPARIDRYGDQPGPIAAAAHSSGVNSAVGVPIFVGGHVWGMIAVGKRHEREALPPETDSRLEAFTELVATAISNTQAHDDLREVAEEQAALRRVATLVAAAAPPQEIFDAVAKEVVNILGLPRVEMVRYESDLHGRVIGATGDHPFPPGSRWPLDGPSIMSMVHETGRPARIDDYRDLSGTIAEVARKAELHSAIGAPIIVDGRTWGVIIAMSTTERVPPGYEDRLAQFTDLVATAVSNLQARDDLRGLAGEQAALRRVATLVARGADAPTVFDAVCRETCRLIGASSVNLAHYTSDGFNVTMAGWSIGGTHLPVGTRLPAAADTIGGLILQTRAPARKDTYDEISSELGTVVRDRGIRSAVAAPVVVEGDVWGALIAGTHSPEPLPPGTERRLARFTELVATAVSNAATRDELIASRARIVAAGDEARRRVERDLHDGTQQRLIALSLDLQAARATIPAELEETHGALQRIERDVQEVLEDVRELSRGLHPSILARAGLLPSLRMLARKSPIRVSLHVDITDRPAESTEIGVYYIVSEALTNAGKHSGASQVGVSVESAGSVLRVRIEDDGVGGAEPGGGSGLVGLMDRVHALGGRFSLISPPAAGTTITIELPLGDRVGSPAFPA